LLPYKIGFLKFFVKINKIKNPLKCRHKLDPPVPQILGIRSLTPLDPESLDLF
jgi:hypothetical protein